MTLTTGPELLLLDEPASGMSAVATGATMALIGRIAPRVPCEQNARTALEIGDWHHTIDNGRIPFSGDSAAVLGSEEVKATYLGVSKRATTQGHREDEHGGT